jgi:hypothetical protein
MRHLAISLFPFIFVCGLPAQPSTQRLVFDATASSPAPVPVHAQLGANRTPDGASLLANNQYLTRNGVPWIPVMGEFHYTRYPEAYWEEEILKMKADGVQIIATYVIWIHHEEAEGQFDWSGQRNLRKFAELCKKHGMLLYPRIGPWAHGEVRNGGLPDWVMIKSAVRSNDPIYLAEARNFYSQIGKQLNGLLWKDGGPVIGIQIENEYAYDGPGKGREHLAELKKMATESGLDVPLYTVTGWDNAVVPEDMFLPVYGGYSAAPWNGSRQVIPPSETYAFRFASRITGAPETLKRQTEAGATHAAALRAATPFLTAELGGGIQDTYYRRPVLGAADVAATIPVMIGSGANLLGYYMYHGGENPDGKTTTLQESQRTGYPTDVPVKSYDFQAPLGEFGQMNAERKELKLYHYFLNDFGADLAPARVIEPSKRPTGAADRSVLRASARFDGQHGFLFVNNHVRELAMPQWPAAQFELRLPGKTLLVPASPIAIPADSYFIWPVNLDLDGITLTYATAQPILKIRSGNDTYMFFSATKGIPAELAFPVKDRAALRIEQGSATQENGLLRLRNVAPGTRSAVTVRGKAGETHIVLLSSEDAENLWRIRIDGHDQLVLSRAQVYGDGKRLILRQVGAPSFDAMFFPAIHPDSGKHAVEKKAGEAAGPFQHLVWHERQRNITLRIEQAVSAGRAPAPDFRADSDRRGAAPVQAPDESSFARANEWRVVVPPEDFDGLSDILLGVHYQGDEARLLDGGHLLTDNFFNGTEWRIGMKRFLDKGAPHTFSLQVLPLSKDAPIFFDEGRAPAMGKDGQAGSLQSIEALPEFEIDLAL